MRFTSKGQATVPVGIRERVGLLVRIVRAKTRRNDGRGARLVAHVRGRGDAGTYGRL
jgi:bifunctional DNA-binding transcriptional regulator/antitoxin component of YhaV-PrlF toxin-antitoxin module